MFDTLTIMIPTLKSIQNIDKINKYKKIYKNLVKNKEDSEWKYSIKLIFLLFQKSFQKIDIFKKRYIILLSQEW